MLSGIYIMSDLNGFLIIPFRKQRVTFIENFTNFVGNK